jgi:hypothetical protein
MESNIKYHIRRLSAMSYAEQVSLSALSREISLTKNEMRKTSLKASRDAVKREYKKKRAFRLAAAGGDNTDGKYYQRILNYLMELREKNRIEKNQKI